VHFERVERRHPDPAGRRVEPRVGEIEPSGGGTRRQLEQPALAPAAHGLPRQLIVDAAPQRVEEDRVLARLLRKDALGQPRHEHDVEPAAARLLYAADEDAAVARGRRLLVEERQPLEEHVAHLVERHRPDRRQWAQLGEHGEHAPGTPQDQRRQPLQRGQPLAPRRARRKRGELVNDGQRESAKVLEVRKVTRERVDAGRLRFVAPGRLEAQPVIGRQARQPARPALATADDGRLHEQHLPLPRGAQRPLHHRGVVGIGTIDPATLGGVGGVDDLLGIAQHLVVSDRPLWRPGGWAAARLQRRHLA
jgi:hypothetical protein